MSKLTIYSASAGSGKTYTISKEYIKLLLTEAQGHRHILAVTFTNKATEEMKSRIIRELHRLSKRENEQYARALSAETGLSVDVIPDAAQKALSHLLHDYSHFSVVTIDSFFQKVIRSFAREMGLHAAYTVELDQISILNEAIDVMIDDLDGNHFLKDWLVEWAKEKIEEGKSWNFKFDIHRLGQEIFAEDLKRIDVPLMDEITDRSRIEIFKKKLEKLLDDYLNHLQNIGKQAMNIMGDHSLSPNDFAYKKSGVGGYFEKLAERQNTTINKHVQQAAEDINGWYSNKSHRKNDIRQAYNDGLDMALQEAVAIQTHYVRQNATIRVILKQLNVLGIFSDLIAYVKQYTRDQNLFLISEASGFLKTIIADADAPFVYERVGDFYHHFMIDEFQDTSAIQWDNFRPLISNSLASGFPDWIVGDVKQSIYRWRNTDWKILSEQLENDMDARNISKKSLNTNWRSAPEVVHFNNAFFRDAVAQICRAFVLDEEHLTADKAFMDGLLADVVRAYSDCYQHLPENEPEQAEGSIHLSMIPQEKDEEEDWREKVLDKLPEQIEALQEQGYRLSDIAILVRENKEAQEIANMLLRYRQTHPDSKYRYDVLSNESLLIKNASAVKWLVAVLRFIVDPDDRINKAFLQHEQHHYLKDSRQAITDLTATNEDVLQQWRSLPVYELSDKLIQDNGLFLDASQAPFIQAFQDILLQYTRREATDLRSFLDWWEARKHNQFITMPDGQDAIRLITIHKSKGLEFEAVLIPFCEWPLAKGGKILWCRPSEAPFNDMKLLPLRFESSLSQTIFDKEYFREKMMSFIDNLNLLYVAFTRAKKALFVYTPKPKKEEFTQVSDLISRIFFQPIAQAVSDKKYIRLADYWQTENLNFVLGQLAPITTTQGNSVAEPATYWEDTAQHRWAHVPHITRHGAYFGSQPVTVQMDKGRLLHDIFRKIITTDDLGQTLNTMICEGKLPESERAQIVEVIHQAVRNPVVRRWFSGAVSVKTEADILLPDGAMARPDRIVFDKNKVQVIDYKFGEKESFNYQKQVRQYMTLLNRMGYANVEGFLWYVKLNKIVPIEGQLVYGTLF
jgi:ATP-dependent exoDNAse (exonuclease V) beta subunit